MHPRPPAPGTSLGLKLYLPGSSAVEFVAGVVRERFTSGREVGFWADFTTLSKRVKERIAALLGSTPPGGEIRRAMPRYTTRLRVSFASERDFVLEYAANISAGGMFVQTDSPPEMDTVVKLLLELPDGGRPAAVEAQVVHLVAPGSSKLS